MKITRAKSIFALIFLLLTVCDARAQNSCDLSAKNAPLLLSLQIGMSPEQTQNVFGKTLKIKIKKKGERTFFQNFIKKPAPDSLRGVRALYFRFFDRRLYQIEIFYEPRPDLATLENIKNALAAQFDLPNIEWQTKTNRAEVKCGDISLIADNILNPRVELTDEIVRAQIEEARKNKEK